MVNPLVDKFGNPALLKDGTDPHFEDYKLHINYGAGYSLTKSKRERSASLDDGMSMINALLAQYELIYEPHIVDKRLLLMPHLFQKPAEGEQIKNTVTGEVYTIEDVITNPITKTWEGLIKISAITPPSVNKSEKLAFLRPEKNLVRFTHSFSENIELDNQDSDGQIADAGPIRPTVTYSLIRKEPGTIGKSPFHPSKEYKPRRRELIKNSNFPGHSIEVYGQMFDHLVQFDTWTTDNFSSEKLADWFEKFMKLYIWVLKLNGVHEILFWQRLRDAAVTKWRQDLISRTLQYFIRIEDLEPVMSKNLIDIDIEIGVNKDLIDLHEAYVAEKVVNPGRLTMAQYQDLFRDADTGKYLFGDVSIRDDGTP
jgi:hypothetical protein